MGQTATEKLLSVHGGRKVKRGDYIITQVDRLLLSDTTAPLAIQSFCGMGGKRVYDPDKVVVFLDHATPCPNQSIANLHHFIREFVADQGIRFHDLGDGICHQLMVEKGYVKPGDVVFGADSHTCTYGGISAFSTGIGSTDAAAIMYTGKIWMKVPETIRIEFTGGLRPHVSGKDIALAIAQRLKADGANYMALEFSGDGTGHLSLADRLTICNMAIEVGAKSGIFPDPEFAADGDAHYFDKIKIDMGSIKPLVACPHQVYNVKEAALLQDVPIHQIFIGSCTNGRYEDLSCAAMFLRGRKVHPGVRLLISPASREILLQATHSGVLSDLVSAGAAILTPGCNACVGTLGGIPGDGENVLSTCNRNFIGRMGNNQANIYLASAATAAASALTGRITDPGTIGEKVYDNNR